MCLARDSVSWGGRLERCDDDRPRVTADYGYLSGDSTPLLIANERRSGTARFLLQPSR